MRRRKRWREVEEVVVEVEERTTPSWHFFITDVTNSSN